MITLSPPRAADSDVLFKWINDPETVRFNAAYRPVARTGHDAWFAGLNRDPSKVFFVILDNDALVGSVQLVDIHPIHRTAEMMIRIGDDADRGQGRGSAALKALLAFAWRDLNLERVWLRVFADNTRAIRAYEKAGFQHEGVMRSAAYIGGKRVDEVVMAALRQS